MFEVKPPYHAIPMNGNMKVFLAGSIEMGKAINWQEQFVQACKDDPVIFYNPRRDNWDSSLPQEYSNAKFREQVEWELDYLEQADIAVFYFDPDTMSPITLMELGTRQNMQKGKTIVCCPHGFWRKGNVDVFCARENIPLWHSLETLIVETREMILKSSIDRS